MTEHPPRPIRTRVQDDEEWRILCAYRDQKEALAQTAIANGVDPGSIDHGWLKTPEFSIHFRSPDFDKSAFMDEILTTVKSHAPEFPSIIRPTQFDSHILLLPIADPHFGKLGIRDKDGVLSYDIDTARERLKSGVDGLLSRIGGYDINRVILVNCGDWLHTEASSKMTTAGTPQDISSDWHTAYLNGFQAMVDVVKSCVAVADTHIVTVPGNHDYASGIMMSHAVEQYFVNSDNITFDVTPQERKFIEFGRNLIMVHHNTQSFKPADILRIMKDEAGESFARCDMLTAYNGHTHHRDVKVGKLKGGDRQLEKQHGPLMIESGISYEVPNRVHVETVETICGDGQDDWHYRKGYFSPAAMSAFIHHPYNGDVVRIRHSF